jgi:UDP-2,4-diacetamido-2,4,6-trideoxy-beta-L-altropyranose hydrolase
MRALDGNLIDRARSAGFTVHQLDDRSAIAEPTWLAVRLEDELAAMRRLLAGLPRTPRWIIVDHYELDATWERAMAGIGSRICAIDDLADRPHDVDLLLDATLADRERYASLVPDRTVRMLGLPYAPLRDAFTAERERARNRDGVVRRVLIFYGGVDWSGETLKALRALRALPGDVRIDVVTGALNPRLAQIEAAIRDDPRACLVGGGSEMAALTAAADMALGAIGTAMWERCFVGVPALITATLPHTRPLGEPLARTGAIAWLGYAPEVLEEAMREQIAALMSDPRRIRAMSDAAHALGDDYERSRAAFVAMFR